MALRPVKPTPLGLSLLAGALLGLGFTFGSLYLLVWVAFVPLLMALHSPSPRPVRQAWRCGLVAGIVFQVIAANWVLHFIQALWDAGTVITALIAALFWGYGALQLALLSVVYLGLQQRTGWPCLLIFPVIVTLAFAGFPTLFNAQLGETQSRFIVAIQGVSLTGVHGLDAIIALANALLYQYLRPRSATPRRDRIHQVVSGLLIVLWLGYGAVVLLSASPPGTRLRVGWVQENGPAGETRASTPGYTDSDPRSLALSRQLAVEGAEVIIWPETGFSAYFQQPRVRQAIHRAAKAMRTPLLLQGIEVADGKQFNTVAWVSASGLEAGRYRKQKRVAFGEYLPLLEYLPDSSRWARQWLSGFFSDIAAGHQPAGFPIAGTDTQLIPLICYEVMFPSLVADASRVGADRQLLVIVSNNAWFGNTAQPWQHWRATALRAVETGRPALHVINNGPSGVFLADGRPWVHSPYGTEAAYLAEVPIPSHGPTLHSRYPNVFLALCLALAGLILVVALRGEIVTHRSRGRPAPR